MLEWWRRVGLACDDHERGAGRTDLISRATAPSFRGRQARPLVEEFTEIYTSCARVAVASMAYNPYSEVVESLWNDYPDAQDEAVSRASMLAQGSLRVCRIMLLCQYITY